MKRILYLEENPQLCGLFSDALTQYDIDTDFCTSGVEALRLHESTPYDLVALDHQNADHDSLDLIQSLLSKDSDLPIILILADNQPRIIAKAMDIGAAYYVVGKTVETYQELIPSIIKRVLSLKNTGSIINKNAMLEQSASLAKLGFWKWDSINSGTLYCSDELALILETTPEEYVRLSNSRKTEEEWVHPEDQHDYKKAISTWYQHIEANPENFGTLEIEYRMITKKGNVVTVLEIITPECDATGKIIFTTGTLQDLTRIRHEGELSREQRFTTDHAENLAQFGTWIWNDDLRVCVYCSEGLAKLHGLSVQGYIDLASTPRGMLDIIHPEDHAKFLYYTVLT